MNSCENNKKWVAIWGNAPSLTDWKAEQYAKNITLTYSCPVPFDSENIRLRFSNRYGSETISLKNITVLYKAKDGSLSGPFVCAERLTIEPGEDAFTGDAVFGLKKDGTLKISFYLDEVTLMESAVLTTGIYSGGKVTRGEYTGVDVLPAELTASTNWNYFLTDVFTQADDECHTIICYGDSITAQDWPDYCYRHFIENSDNKTAIVRKAVSGTRVLRQYDCLQYRSYGIKGDIRFPHESDVMGADAILIQHGINDIIHPVGTEVNVFRPWSDLPTAEQMIEGFRNYIKIARERGLKIYFGTLLPIEGWRTYAEFRNELRCQINDWIRTTDEIDGYIDFETAVRNPDRPACFGPGQDSGDHLHPSTSAYKTMGLWAYEKLK